MKFVIKMCDWNSDKAITKEVDAKSVFDAIDIVAKSIENPEETELIEAYPIKECDKNGK